MTENLRTARPTVEQLDRELARRRHRKDYRRAMRGTVWTLTVVAAVAILCSTFFLSVLRIQGSSMAPTLEEHELVLAARGSEFRPGDIIAFYYNNQVLLKRVVCSGGDWVDIKENGDVYVNGVLVDEPYADHREPGASDVQYPYQVPENRYFVLGDHRSVSVDSRYSVVGCVSAEQVVGKVICKIWPLDRLEP